MLSRKYIRIATDNDEHLAFLLGELVRTKYRIYLLSHGNQTPPQISVKLEEFEKRVSSLFNPLPSDSS